MSRRQFPLVSLIRSFAQVSAGRDFPLAAVEALVVLPGTSKRLLLGELGYPFGDLWIDQPLEVDTIETKEGSGSFSFVSLGNFPDLMTATRFQDFTPQDFNNDLRFTIKVTDLSGGVIEKELTVVTDVEIGIDKASLSNQTIKPFSDATFAEDPAEVTLVKYEVAGATTIAKTDIPREVMLTGTHDGAGNNASLVDTTKDFLNLGVRVGEIVKNTTDGSQGVVTALATTTNPNDTLTMTLSGGTEDDWDASDAYQIEDGRSIILIAREFEIKFTAVGSSRATLFVTDNGVPTEFSDAIQIEVTDP